MSKRKRHLKKVDLIKKNIIDLSHNNKGCPMQNGFVLDWSIDDFFDKKHINKIVRDKGYSVSPRLATKCKKNIKMELGVKKVFELCFYTPENVKTRERLGTKSLALITLMLDNYRLKLGEDYTEQLQVHYKNNQGEPVQTKELDINMRQKSKIEENKNNFKDEKVTLPETVFPKDKFLKPTKNGYEYVSEKEIVNYVVEKLLNAV